MQAIQTKYIGPSNVKGSRIKAKCAAGSLTMSWDDALNPRANHQLAAEALAKKLGWSGLWCEGGLIDGSSVFVCFDHDYTFTIKAAQAA